MTEDSFFSQADAEALLRMEKISASIQPFYFSGLGGRLEIPLSSRDQRESFSLDINQKRISLKTGLQTRGRQVIVLARLDFASPHRNPDGVEVGIPHLHLYREGYGDKWAYDIPDGMLSNPDDVWQVLQDFMLYCHIMDKPNIIRGLFA